MRVRFSYLKEKFGEPDKIWERVRETVKVGDFTLGKEVEEFEQTFARLMGVRFAVGVANGTDALVLSLWNLGVRAGDEVITAANTFVASLGAIGLVQARPRLVDMAPDYVMDAKLIEKAITKKTKAIIPVHFCGNPVAMDEVMYVANKHGLPVVEDACQAYLAQFSGRSVGTFGATGAFSLHPLKILNVWGDGGVITTNDESTYKELKLLQNHGMQTRDLITRFPCFNSRLDSVHAAVANSQILDTPEGVKKRQANAKYYDEKLEGIVHITPRDKRKSSVYHLYFIEVPEEKRDGLYGRLLTREVEAKIHYPIPLYQQPGLRDLGYKPGDFPIADYQSRRYITLPVDELVTRDMQDYVISVIKEYMCS